MKSLWLGYITKMLQLLCFLPHFSAALLYKYGYALRFSECWRVEGSTPD